MSICNDKCLSSTWSKTREASSAQPTDPQQTINHFNPILKYKWNHCTHQSPHSKHAVHWGPMSPCLIHGTCTRRFQQPFCWLLRSHLQGMTANYHFELFNSWQLISHWQGEMLQLLRPGIINSDLKSTVMPFWRWNLRLAGIWKKLAVRSLESGEHAVGELWEHVAITIAAVQCSSFSGTAGLG
jgi:hypothetical protein